MSDFYISYIKIYIYIHRHINLGALKKLKILRFKAMVFFVVLLYQSVLDILLIISLYFLGVCEFNKS